MERPPDSNRLRHWEQFLERIGPENQSLGAAVLLEEAKAESRPSGRAMHGDLPILWRHWVEIPEGADLNTPLGLYCEKGYVIPIGPGALHLQFHCAPGNQTSHGFYVTERGHGPGPIEMHANTCGCALKVKPLDARDATWIPR